MYEGYVELAERLNALAPGRFAKKSFFLNSGAEAVENAVKIARHETGRPAVIAFQNGFHGRSLLTMSLTSKVKPYKYRFGPFAPEVYRAPYAYCYRCPLGLTHPACGAACADYLEEFFVSHVAAERTDSPRHRPNISPGCEASATNTTSGSSWTKSKADSAALESCSPLSTGMWPRT
jgi:4-aminobutyrate aminotransferase/(S)-3-amino-2-methylpropionate transaminase